MLPGKKYKPEDFLLIAWRHKWLIVVPFVVVALGTVLYSRTLPDQYRSQTVILVIPQRVPESYVRSTVTAKIEDRLQTIRQQILSRTRLERVILDFNLFPTERQKGIMEDVVELMRKNIGLDIVPGRDAFSVSYVSEDPRTTMKVVDRLSAMFMDESRADRAVLAEATTDFLQNQLDEARRRLVDHEQKLAAYQRSHAGQLPSERDANLQVLNNTQMQVQQVVESTNRDRDRRVLLERSITDLEADVAAAPPLSVTLSADDPTAITSASASVQLEVARSQLRALELRLTPEHPDIRRIKRVISELEQKTQAEALQKPLSPDPSSDRPLTPDERSRQERMKALRTELQGLDLQIQARQNEEQRLRGVIESYQQRLEATPNRESELIALTRDYATLQGIYQGLLAKQEDSKISSNLERRQIGEQFQVLDPARLPERPFSPNRPFINLVGALAGLGIGVGLVAFVNYRDTSFRTDDEIVSVLALPVLAMIPVMMTAAERRKAKRVKVGVILASATALAIVGALLAWRFDLWNRLTR